MRVLWLSAFIVALDQVTKAAVVQFMYRQQSISVLGDWLRLTFTENPGMAFGITVGPPGLITAFAIVATVLVGVYIYQVRDSYAPYRWSLAFILGGAIGNIVDRVFYGVLLDYGTFFTGRVVDFLHLSVWQGFIPNIIPVVGGAYLEFFPIGNVADVSIMIGVAGVLVFHRTFHEREYESPTEDTAAEETLSPAANQNHEAKHGDEAPEGSPGITEEEIVAVEEGTDGRDDEASSRRDRSTSASPSESPDNDRS